VQIASAFGRLALPSSQLLGDPSLCTPACGKGQFRPIPSHLQALPLLLWDAFLSAPPPLRSSSSLPPPPEAFSGRRVRCCTPLPAGSSCTNWGASLASPRAGPDPTKTGQLGAIMGVCLNFLCWPICSLKAGSTANTTSKCCLLRAADPAVRAGCSTLLCTPGGLGRWVGAQVLFPDPLSEHQLSAGITSPSSGRGAPGPG